MFYLLRSSAIVCDHDRRIADDRRSMFPYDRRRSQTIADLIAICDLRSAIIWKPALDSKSCGVVILFNNTFEYVLHNVISDQQGRYIVLDISIFQQRCTLVTLYGPDTDSTEFFTNLKENLINWELSNQPIILCGDWNVVLNYHNDTINYSKENNPKAQKSVLDLIDTFELGDVYRDQEPTGRSSLGVRTVI